MPTVSVVIPTYNRSEFLYEAINSVFHQTYQDFEVIVVDDGSTDNTESIISKFDGRVRYFKQANSGSAVARNRGILNSRGNFIAFLDSDDLWYPQKLEKQIKVFEKHPDVGLVFCDCSRGNSMSFPAPKRGYFSNVNFSQGNLFPLLCKMNPVWTPSVICRYEVFNYSGLMDHTLRRAQDIDLWIRIASITNAFFLREVLVHVREHKERISYNTDFLYDVCRKCDIQVSRWSSCDEKIVNILKEKAADRYYQLSYVERKKGNYYKSYLALCKSMRYMKKPYKYWPRKFITRFFPIIFKIYDRYRPILSDSKHNT